MGMPLNLWLVRHGHSEGNEVVKKYEETGDESFFSDEFLDIHESKYKLTELGREQAQKAGEWFRENNIKNFYRMLVSSNVRARQTASLLNLPGAKWMMDNILRERDHGLFNVIKPSHRDFNYPDQQKFHDTQPYLFRPPQGESLADVDIRVKVVLDTLGRECDGKKNVIIVCHGHVIRCFRMRLERMSIDKCNEYLTTSKDWARVPNCSITHYTRKDPYTQNISDYFGWVRMIRPAGGGEFEDKFSLVSRKKFSNKELVSKIK